MSDSLRDVLTATASTPMQRTWAEHITLAVVNRSTEVSDDDVRAFVLALDIQIERDFSPAWGIDAHPVFVGPGETPPPGSWWLVFLDDTDQQEALGYHDLTPDFMPMGKVFVRSAKALGYTWTVTASHEALELLADPAVNQTAFLGTTLYAWEVADPVQHESYAYDIGGVKMTDFVYPSWFQDFRQPGSCKFDHTGAIDRPLALAPGGYISIFDVLRPGLGWTNACKACASCGPSHGAMVSSRNAGSRAGRRPRDAKDWEPSAPK